MSAAYLWLKAFHIIGVVTWFAAMFYLPRLFIYHRMASDTVSRERFSVMETRLFVIMSIGAILTGLFGFALLLANPALLQFGWFSTKLVLLSD